MSVRPDVAVMPFGSMPPQAAESLPGHHLSRGTPLARLGLGQVSPVNHQAKSMMHHASGWRHRPHDPHPFCRLGRDPDAGEAGCSAVSLS